MTTDYPLESPYVDDEGNERIMRRQRVGTYPFKWGDGHTSETTLYDADPDCEHEALPNKWSGIECRKCGGWFCY